MSTPTSQQVSFWSAHEWAMQYLDTVPDFPLIGTPEWVAMPDSDRRKWASVIDAAQHWALRVETAQEARAEAARAIGGSAPWAQVAREIQQRSAFREAHPWSRRKAVQHD